MEACEKQIKSTEVEGEKQIKAIKDNKKQLALLIIFLSFAKNMGEILIQLKT